MASLDCEQSLKISWWDDPVGNPETGRRFKVEGVPRAKEIEKRLSERYLHLLRMGRIPLPEDQQLYEEKLFLAEMELEGMVPPGTWLQWGREK